MGMRPRIGHLQVAMLFGTPMWPKEKSRIAERHRLSDGDGGNRKEQHVRVLEESALKRSTCEVS